MVIQIRDRRDGSLVYSSPSAADLSLRGALDRPIYQLVHGQTFEVFEVDTPRWSVLWGRTLVDAPSFVRVISGDLLQGMTIAFPILLLTAWLAVSHGLRPLRRLSQAITARGPAALSPAP